MKIKDTKSFILKAKTIHGEKFNYSKSVYINAKTPISIICKKCNYIFNPTPSNHILGSGCPHCGQEYNRQKKLTTEKFILLSKKVHGDLYDYSKSVYINAKTKITIICKKCKTEFYQIPTDHMYAEKGCGFCKRSHGETKISMILKALNIDHKIQHRFDDCRGTKKPLPFDFYIPHLNICIEYDGKQHYDKDSKFFSNDLIKNDLIKSKYCKERNIKLLKITQDKFKELDFIIKKWLIN